MARILIVEDDTLFAEVLARILGQDGHEVFVADDDVSGIEQGVAYHPDVVVADWMLRSPLHGGEVCRRIRAVCPRVRTIVITGYREMAVYARIGCYGVDEVVEKPFHAEQILRAIRRLTPEAEFAASP